MLFDTMRQNLMKQPISAPTIAIGFMGGVVLPILLTNAIATNHPNSIYQGKTKGELNSIHYNLENLNKRITNIHNQIDHTDIDEDYDFNDILF